jgi:hypothetical protein
VLQLGIGIGEVIVRGDTTVTVELIGGPADGATRRQPVPPPAWLIVQLTAEIEAFDVTGVLDEGTWPTVTRHRYVLDPETLFSPVVRYNWAADITESDRT